MAHTRHVRINSPHGLHARPAMELSAICQKHPGNVRLRKENGGRDQIADGKNILDIMVLAVARGEIVVVEADGSEAEAILESIAELLERDEDAPA